MNENKFYAHTDFKKLEGTLLTAWHRYNIFKVSLVCIAYILFNVQSSLHSLT